ncbi:MAG: TetR family transcriptional regulator C-terminal domain-containing protein [Candidatus Binatia bacterium]
MRIAPSERDRSGDDKDRTREGLLQAGFEEIYRHGFRAARVDRILSRTNVTKGAFYHHFPTKRALGEAIIDELVWEKVHDAWIKPLEDSDDPVATLVGLVRQLARSCDDDSLACGCPLGNLAQELSPVDEDFRRQISGVFVRWVGAFAEALRRGQQAARIAASVDPVQASVFVVAALEGGIGMAKHSRDRAALQNFTDGLCSYLELLRPP